MLNVVARLEGTAVLCWYMCHCINVCFLCCRELSSSLALYSCRVAYMLVVSCLLLIHLKECFCFNLHIPAQLLLGFHTYVSCAVKGFSHCLSWLSSQRALLVWLGGLQREMWVWMGRRECFELVRLLLYLPGEPRSPVGLCSHLGIFSCVGDPVPVSVCTSFPSLVSFHGYSRQ